MDMWVRPLRVVDISRVAEIERQAFPTLRPPTPFLRDLEGRQIKYLVAGEPKTVEPLEGQPEQPSGPVKGSRWARVLVAVRERFRFHQAGVQLDYNIPGISRPLVDSWRGPYHRHRCGKNRHWVGASGSYCYGVRLSWL